LTQVAKITHYKESATIINLIPEWWGSPLVQEEKYQEKSVKREAEIIIIEAAARTWQEKYLTHEMKQQWIASTFHRTGIIPKDSS
jgi:hypothetical protein